MFMIICKIFFRNLKLLLNFEKNYVFIDILSINNRELALFLFATYDGFINV